ncbi:flagellar type III secretion system pore protein FliP [Laribacter hongkongensis]|uniref:flagellar type III secretion system pore protein FliP n=1 Tax=Laribacter hongkongensis TaxID=168471 RepID=UPI001EFCF380|nr:flagellar type III secretion system pore protein FliP [Laribacter hongkongensis]MCG9064376.1 flagellar type III secretion system pore protein FliP [Laribacter hongkongensis]
MKSRFLFALPWLAMGGLLVADAAAAPNIPFMNASPTGGAGTQYSLSLEMLLFLTSLTFIPALLLMMTAFTRIVIVLSLLRQAIGLMQSPPNQVIVGLSLFLTLFVMAPVFDQAYREAWLPYSDSQMNFMQAAEKGVQPFKGFMLKQTREKDLAFFVEIAREAPPATPADVSLKTLIPAFVVSELKTAFQIGFMVFIPFLIIDLVVASVLMAMGMMMVSPVIISLPFKLMLFVLVDGWTLLIGSLVQSFYLT